jgi:hypothetical protein
MRRRGRRDFVVVGGSEQTWEIRERPATNRDVECRTDKKSHHMMKEPVGFYFEHEPARPFPPARFENATAMIVVRGRRTPYGEAPEAVFTLEVGGRRIQSAPLEGLPECELVPTTKW